VVRIGDDPLEDLIGGEQIRDYLTGDGDIVVRGVFVIPTRYSPLGVPHDILCRDPLTKWFVSRSAPWVSTTP
jgi:hypothetical protein